MSMKNDINELISEELRNTQLEKKETSLESDPGKKIMLKVISGPDQGKAFYLHGTQNSIGRGPAEISLKDIDVSRLHALIEYVEGEQLVIRDTGSTNGTYVNGVRIAEITLKSGDEIQVGSTVFKFTIETLSEKSSE